MEEMTVYLVEIAQYDDCGSDGLWLQEGYAHRTLDGAKRKLEALVQHDIDAFNGSKSESDEEDEDEDDNKVSVEWNDDKTECTLITGTAQTDFRITTTTLED